MDGRRSSCECCRPGVLQIGETSERTWRRVLIATNRDVGKRSRKTVSEDLFYRIINYCVTLPPLRERHGELEMLSHYFIKSTAPNLTRQSRESPRKHHLLKATRFPETSAVGGDISARFSSKATATLQWRVSPASGHCG